MGLLISLEGWLSQWWFNNMPSFPKRQQRFKCVDGLQFSDKSSLDFFQKLKFMWLKPSKQLRIEFK